MVHADVVTKQLMKDNFPSSEVANFGEENLTVDFSRLETGTGTFSSKWNKIVQCGFWIRTTLISSRTLFPTLTCHVEEYVFMSISPWWSWEKTWNWITHE
jgi:hypothetical protein